MDDRLRILAERLAKLDVSERDKRIVEYRLGLAQFDNPKSHTLQATGEVFGMTRERVRQIEKRILDQIDN